MIGVGKGKDLGLTAEKMAFYAVLSKQQAIKDFYEKSELIEI